jgi:hypothetical protein
MSFETIMISVVFVIYFSTGVGYAIKGNWPWAIVWVSYAMANVGMIWASLVKK